MSRESGSYAALTLAAAMHISSQPRVLTILIRTKIRTMVKMRAMPVAIAETARSAGPLLPGSLNRDEIFRLVIISCLVFTPELETSVTVCHFDESR